MTRVFISYRHDDGTHSENVRQLAERLREAGVDVVIDYDQLPGGPNETWPKWSQQQVEYCDKVLIACCAGWRESYEANAPLHAGRGAAAEAHIIRQELYELSFINPKFRVVLFDPANAASIPKGLSGYHHYDYHTPEGQQQLHEWVCTTPTPTVSISWPTLPPATKPRLANCEAEFAAFHRLVRGQSEQRALLIHGTSGSGKSRLTSEFRRQALKAGIETALIDFKGGQGMEQVLHCLAADLVGFSPKRQASIIEQRGHLNEHLKKQRTPLLLLLDTFEQADEAANQWLANDLLTRLHLFPALALVVCGQQVPDKNQACWQDEALGFALAPIENPEKWRDYCAQLAQASPSPTDCVFIDRLVELSKGNPSQIGPLLEKIALGSHA